MENKMINVSKLVDEIALIHDYIQQLPMKLRIDQDIDDPNDELKPGKLFKRSFFPNVTWSGHTANRVVSRLKVKRKH